MPDMPRIAWFSPVPPSTSGIAAYTSEVVPLLDTRLGAIDLYDERAAQHFVWRNRRQPYDLVVYQLGNASCHDFMWAYLFRYPGLVVLHDAQLHQSRALSLLRRLEPRRDDYFAELAANHPAAPAHLGELVAAGLGGSLFHLWPMVTLVLRRARVTAVHSLRLAGALSEHVPGAHVEAIRMGVTEVGDVPGHTAQRPPLRDVLRIPEGAVVVAAFGGVTPEKRIASLVAAVAGLSDARVHVLLVGARAAHYDVDADIRSNRLEGRVHIAGHVPDDELPSYLMAADICACLRWPTNRETSASWLRCLAAGKPTIITRLWHLDDVPTLEASADGLKGDRAQACAVSVDPLDEPVALPVALRALVASPPLRRDLGARALARWQSEHRLELAAADYERVIAHAMASPVPAPALPAHLLDDGTGTVRRLLVEMGLTELPW
jgi:glycosyltransferase involved in cell wall biosynthesis